MHPSSVPRGSRVETDTPARSALCNCQRCKNNSYLAVQISRDHCHLCQAHHAPTHSAHQQRAAARGQHQRVSGKERIHAPVASEMQSFKHLLAAEALWVRRSDTQDIEQSKVSSAEGGERHALAALLCRSVCYLEACRVVSLSIVVNALCIPHTYHAREPPVSMRDERWTVL